MVVDFLGPVNPPGRRTCARYIITMTYYLTRWVEVALVIDCTAATAIMFSFDHVVTRFVFPKILVSNQGMHFVNKVIEKMSK